MYTKIIGLSIVIALGLISLRKGWVDFLGLISGFVVGGSIVLLGDLKAFLPMMAFYLSGSLATKLKYKRKVQKEAAQPKGGARSWQNVFANGLMPVVFLVLWRTLGSERWLFAYIASVSASIADTLSNEIGVLNPSPPRLVTRPWMEVDPGTSGGVSPLGFLVALVAPFLLGSLTSAVGLVGSNPVLFSTITGFFGSLVDSIIGAEWQALYLCPKCDKITESKVHRCGTQAKLIKGYSWLSNDLVNLIMSGTTGLVGYLISVRFI
ncbi:MAG: hypothetical protein DRO00_00465 [Thermoproteota archaeon]|nr:MAG: hypothetical protein DRO00_00465 [Candidatus Korarchaeota archaeon]